MNALSVDLRGGTAAADPLDNPFRQCLVIQFLTPTQGAFPDNQDPPSQRLQFFAVPLITYHIFSYLLQPERRAGCRDFKEIAVMLMPETAVGKENTTVVIHHKIGATGQRCILRAKRYPLLRQDVGQTFFDRRIAGPYRPHIFTACRLIVNVCHAAVLSHGAQQPV